MRGVARGPAAGRGPRAPRGPAPRPGGPAGRPGRRQGPGRGAAAAQREPGAPPVPRGGQAHRVSSQPAMHLARLGKETLLLSSQRTAPFKTHVSLHFFNAGSGEVQKGHVGLDLKAEGRRGV